MQLLALPAIRYNVGNVRQEGGAQIVERQRKGLRTGKAECPILLVRRSREASANQRTLRRTFMLHYAVVFFVIALVAALFGFGGIAVGAAGIAKILFVVFLILAVASFIFGRGRGGRGGL